jgi:hypothetical protein
MAFPDWRGGDTGVVIGIGYDLGSRTRCDFVADWRGLIPEDTLELLAEACGKRGLQAARIIRHYRHIRIPYESAVRVWSKSQR